MKNHEVIESFKAIMEKPVTIGRVHALFARQAELKFQADLDVPADKLRIQFVAAVMCLCEWEGVDFEDVARKAYKLKNFEMKHVGF